MESAELLGTLVEATLATSAALVLVLVLRRRLRAAFGARVAYAAWWLVPAALVAVLLPAAVQVPVAVNVAPVVAAPVATSAPVVVAAPVDFSAGWLAAWVLGAVVLLVAMARLQHRFRRTLGPLRARGDGLHEADAVAGLPAAMGLVRPRIVVPADFERRYDPDERELMHAHERMHIRAGDLHSNALASALRCAFWFNPLVHVAWFAFRHDQELACDQRVISRYPHARRRYGEAMFKTQLAAHPLPLACHWGFGHPLKERIAMLNRPVPSRARRAGGAVLMTALALGVGFAAWSAQPARTAEAPKAAAGRPLPKGHVMASIEARVDANREESFVIANRAGEPFAISVGEGASAYEMEATMKPLSGDRIQLDAVLTQGGKVVGKPKLVVADGKQAVISIGEESAPGAFRGIHLAMTMTTRGELPTPPLPPAPPVPPAPPAALPGLPPAPALAPPVPPAPAKAGGLPVPPAPPAPPAVPASGTPLPPVPPSEGSRSAPEVAAVAQSAQATAPVAPMPDTGASFARMSPPAYPKGAALKGRVMMEVDVRADGQVAGATVVRSSGDALLDDAARDAVLKWRFNPAYRAGTAVASRVRVPIDFGTNEANAGEDPDALESIQVNR